MGRKVYAAPHSAPKLLELDLVTEIPDGIDTEGVESGGKKWAGITAVGMKVYAAPY